MTWGRKIGRKEVRRKYGGFSGRPQEIGDSDEQLDQSCFSRNSKGWKPEITTLHQSHLMAVHWGPLGLRDPPNISANEKGFNTSMWQSYDNVADALRYLGYHGRDGVAMLRAFQRDWNAVSSRAGTHPKFQNLDWKVMPSGNLAVDGEVGPRVLNALEIAIANSNIISWQQVVLEAHAPDTLSLGRKKLFNAIEGGS